ncbi:MAG: DUF3341 domain-containing protein [Gammaproteobacteria bacterium]|nr:DUF3341 domain-containing protein [Gammaproteobacteria bacterium]MDE0259008.1 DUF3341 domain-containing protein [Gammaproteobacteria bacterium]
MSAQAGLLASFDYLDGAVDAVKALRKSGFSKIIAYSPLPEHHLEEALGYDQSPVRVFALVGGLTGAATGFAFTTWTSMDWPLVTGGKPIVSIPAYFIIAFELAVLFGALATVIGVFINAKLPRLRPPVVYDPGFSGGRFGIHVSAPADRIEEARRILTGSGPAELTEEPAPSHG